MEQKHMSNDLSNTRCFIDADGTLFDSLPYYNNVFDTMFLGKYTDKNYNEYRDEIDRIYDFIPGTPWHDIIAAGVEYLTGTRPSAAETSELEAIFEDRAAEMFRGMSAGRLAIAPVIDFCRTYRERGGSIIIHSGTNEKILRAMLEACGITDLFDDYLTSNMVFNGNNRSNSVSSGGASKWAYKTTLLNHLLGKYPSNGTRNFVVGDTKGDAFGAKEVGMPFLLIWRGYPKDPCRLTANNERTEFISPDAWVDMRDEVIASSEARRNAAENMLEFASNVSAGVIN